MRPNGVRASALARRLSAVGMMVVVVGGLVPSLARAGADASGAGPGASAPAPPAIVVAATTEPPPPPRPKPPPKGSIKTSGARLKAVLADGGEPLYGGIEWRVTPADGAGELVVSDDAIAEIELAPGRYRARAVAEFAEVETEFTVKFDQVTPVTVPLDAGMLEAVVVPGAAAMPLDLATVAVRRAGDTGSEPLVTAIGGRLEVVLPAGDYDIEASVGLVDTSRTVEVEAGTTAHAELVLEVGFVVAEAVAAEGTEPLSQATFSLRPAGETETGELARATGRRGIFAVGPGEYRLTCRYGLASVDELVRVAGNGLTQVTMTLDAARLELDVLGPDPRTGPGAPARFRVLRQSDGGADEIVTEIEGAAPSLRLPAGDYAVEAQRDGALARDRVTLEPGERTDLRLTLAPGLLRVRASDGSAPIPGAAIELSAAPLDGGTPDMSKLVDLGRVSASPASLPAGRYRIFGRLVQGDATAEASVEIREGTSSDVELAFDIGRARLTLTDKPGGAALDDTSWVVRQRGSPVAIRAVGGSVELPLAPGTYTVVADAGTRTASGQITIDSGAVAELSLVAK